MTKFETKSGSTYEVDEENKRIRWISGDRRHRTLPDAGQWRAFYAIDFGVEVGFPVVIYFEKSERPLITTRVTAVHGQRAA